MLASSTIESLGTHQSQIGIKVSTLQLPARSANNACINVSQNKLRLTIVLHLLRRDASILTPPGAAVASR